MITTCKRSHCENQFDNLSESQPIPKRYCSEKCRKLDYRRRNNLLLRSEAGEQTHSMWVASRAFAACLDSAGKIAENEGLEVSDFEDRVINDLEDLIEKFWAYE